MLVKQSRTLFKLGNSGQGPVCSAVKWSSNKNNSQNFFEPSRRCDYSAYDSDHALIQQNKEDKDSKQERSSADLNCLLHCLTCRVGLELTPFCTCSSFQTAAFTRGSPSSSILGFCHLSSTSNSLFCLVSVSGSPF